MPKAVGRPLIWDNVEAFDNDVDKYLLHTVKEKLPVTIIGFAVFIKVDKDTLVEYGKKQMFSVSYKRLKDLCEASMVNNALSGKYNPTISIFLLKNNHGYQDKTEVVSEEKPKTITIKRLDERKQ